VREKAYRREDISTGNDVRVLSRRDQGGTLEQVIHKKKEKNVGKQGENSRS